MYLVRDKKAYEDCSFENVGVNDAQLYYYNCIITIFVLNPSIDIFEIKLIVAIFMLNLLIIIDIFALKLHCCYFCAQSYYYY